MDIHSILADYATKKSFTVKPDVRFPRNIATLLGILQFWLRDCSEQVATDVIKLQVEIHNQICKQSLW
jgi:hypothetical protein